MLIFILLWIGLCIIPGAWASVDSILSTHPKTQQGEVRPQVVPYYVKILPTVEKKQFADRRSVLEESAY